MSKGNDNYLEFVQKNTDLLDCCTSSNVDDLITKFIPSLNRNGVFNLVSKYPQIGYEKIKDGLRKKFGIKKVLLGDGSEGLIVSLNRHLNSTHSRVLVVTPTFYRIYKTLNHRETIQVSGLKNDILDGFDAVWLTNPNTIDGSTQSVSELLGLIKSNRKTTFIVDETSVLFLGSPKENSLFPYVESCPNLIVISSFSKFYGLPGIRFGFLSGNCSMMDDLLKQASTFPVDNITQEIVINLLNDKHIDEQIRSKICKNQKMITDLLTKQGDIDVKTSKLNYIFLKSSQKDIKSKLLKSGIATFDLSSHEDKMNGWVRLTIHGSEKLNKILITRVKRYLKNDKR